MPQNHEVLELEESLETPNKIFKFEFYLSSFYVYV